MLEGGGEAVVSSYARPARETRGSAAMHDASHGCDRLLPAPRVTLCPLPRDGGSAALDVDSCRGGVVAVCIRDRLLVGLRGGGGELGNFKILTYRLHYFCI